MDLRKNVIFVSLGLAQYVARPFMLREKLMKFKILLIQLVLLVFNSNAQDYKNLYFEHINNTHGLLSDEVYTSAQDSNGFVWFGTGEGIVRFDGYEFKSFKKHPHLGKMYGIVINKIHVDSEGNYYVCTNDGFFAFNKHFEAILPFAEARLKGQKLNDVLKASDGTVYISSHNGLYLIKPGSESVTELFYSEDNGMVSSLIKQIVEDKQGRIWVAPWANYVLKLNEDKKSFTPYKLFDPTSGSEAATNDLFIDSRGYLWVGSWEKGLYVLDISSENQVNIIKEFKHDPKVQNSIPGDIILSIGEDKYNSIWIGTPYGLSLIQYPFSKKHKIYNYKPDEQPGSINGTVITHLLNDNSDILWLATKGGGIFKLLIEKNKFEHLKIPNLNPQRRNQAVHTFEIDQKGRLLAGVLSIGFVIYDLQEKEFIHFEDVPEYKVISKYINLNTVRDFMWDRDSVLWIGTRYNGLVLLDVKKGIVDVIKNQKNNQGPVGRQVNVICPLQNGLVLVGTNDCLNLMI